MIVLSKNNCPNCVRLKAFLEGALGVEFTEINLDKQPEEFNSYREKFNFMAVPVIIKDDKILLDTAPSKVIEFLGM